MRQFFYSARTAMTSYNGSDYSACVTICHQNNAFYILDVYRSKLDFPSLKKKILELKNKWNVEKILIEDKGSGTSLLQQLRSEGVYAHAYKPEGSKQDRVVAQSDRIAAGSVFLPVHAAWHDDFRAEITAFPYCKHDDQIDALSQGLHWLTQRKMGFFDSFPVNFPVIDEEQGKKPLRLTKLVKGDS